MNKFILSIVTLCLMVTLQACTNQTDTPIESDVLETENLPYESFIDSTNPEVAITINNTETITIQLFPEVAPNTVNNFLSLASQDFYQDILLHRVIEGFVVQGGDPTGTGTSGAGYHIYGEFTSNNFDNPLKHSRGVISMARAQGYNSASSQFFIVHEDAYGLDGDYAAFGGVVAGFDSLDALATTETDSQNKPVTDLVITEVKVELNGYNMQDVEAIDTNFYTYDLFTHDTNPKVIIEYEEIGSITVELFPMVAPETVENFLSLIDSNFYDRIIMHRVISGFIVQGGDPTGTGSSGSDTKIFGEFRENNFENPLSHTRGVISMARSNLPNSASSQFFFVHQDATFLDGKYAAFGVITDGWDVLDVIAASETNSSDKPLEDIIIKTITIIE